MALGPRTCVMSSLSSRSLCSSLMVTLLPWVHQTPLLCLSLDPRVMTCSSLPTDGSRTCSSLHSSLCKCLLLSDVRLCTPCGRVLCPCPPPCTLPWILHNTLKRTIRFTVHHTSWSRTSVFIPWCSPSVQSAPGDTVTTQNYLPDE